MLKNELHQLVHSLSRMEKRYVRMRARQFSENGDARYAQLFEILLDQPEYDKAAILEHFAGEAFLKQFSVAKHYLFHLILQALRGFYAEKSSELEFSRRLDEIQLLYHRQMYGACKRMIRQTKKKAAQLEWPLKMLEILRWEMRLCRALPGKDFGKRLDELHAEEELALQQMQWESALTRLYDRVFPLMLAQQSLEKDVVGAELSEVISHELIASPPAELAFEARIIRAFTLVFCHHLMGNPTAAHAAYSVLLRIWQGNPTRQRTARARYARALMGFLDTCFEVGKFPDAEATFDTLYEIAAKDANFRQSQALRMYNLQLRFFLRSSRYEDAKSIVPQIAAHLEKTPSESTKSLVHSVYCNVGNVFFILGEFRPCIQWLHRLTRIEGKGIRHDIQIIARILSMISHFELENSDLLQHLMSGLQRYLRRTRTQADFALLIGESLLRIAATPQSQHTALFAQFSTQLHDTGPFILSREVHAWLAHRRTGRPIATFLQSS
ncbi:MAG: hypothetical protein AAF570_09200 [Bacteroidota bacterium]